VHPSSKAATVPENLAELPADRRKEIAAARALVRKHMPKGYKETIPLSTDGNTFNRQPLCYVALAAQKNCNTLYLMLPYADGTVNRPSFTQTWPFTETVRSVKKFQRT
jgi:hypothetical protein